MENEVKEPAPKYNFISPGEYLEMERASEEKHEYYEGYVEAMSGASLSHNNIASNLQGEIFGFLKGKECQVLPSEMRVCTPTQSAYVYPDLSIVCDEPRLEDNQFDTLTNPSVVFEILSKSTQKNDLGYKFHFYKTIPSLKEYIMIDSRKRYAYITRKQDNGTWITEERSLPTAELYIQTIDLRISFDDIYRNTGL